MAAFQYKKETTKVMYRCNRYNNCSFSWKCSHAVPHTKGFSPHSRGDMPSDCPMVNHFGPDILIRCERVENVSSN